MKICPNHTEIMSAAARTVACSSATVQAAMELVQAGTEEAAGFVLPAGFRAFAELCPAPAPAGSYRRARAVTSLGRVHFDCPACHRLTVLPFTHRGRRVSCPKCYTAIRVPHPSHHIPAQNLGRTLQPLLRPGDFSHCVDARNLLPWLAGRLPTASQTIAAIGTVLLLAGTMALAPVTLTWAAHDRVAATQHPVTGNAEVIPGTGQNLILAANTVVQEFLQAPTAAAKAAFVIDAPRTTLLMADWYGRRAGGGAQSGAVITASHQGFYATPGDSMAVSEVTVESPGEPVITYLVEHRAEGPRIAWPESVGYSPIAWDQLVREPWAQSPVPLRVLACRDDYYNFAFPRESDFCCVRLHDPQTMELLGFGYLPRTPALTEGLATTLPDAAAGVLTPVTLAVLPQANSQTTQQVRIMGSVTPGWKIPPAPTLASR